MPSDFEQQIIDKSNKIIKELKAKDVFDALRMVKNEP